MEKREMFLLLLHIHQILMNIARLIMRMQQLEQELLFI
nr:MAG TPA: hypothetical protein [Bacteriophage sp.]